MRRGALWLTLIATAALPTAAAAQAPAPAAGSSARVAAAPPAAPAPPAQLPMTLSLDNVGGKRRAALARDRIRIRGSVGAYVPGQVVVVSVFRGSRRVHVKPVVLQPGPGGSGVFLVRYKPKRVGRIVARAEHVATPALGAFGGASRPVEILPRRVGPRSDRVAVRALQARLSGLGYVVGRRGSYDARTSRAVLAFRKMTGMARTTSATKPVMRRIARGRGRFRIHHPRHGRHLEADISRQVLVLIEGRRVRRIYPISSGKASTPTVLGSFRVYSKTSGTNSVGMVHSAYFIGGYATHGYHSVPTFPASHGCLRVPIPDALSLFRWIRIGTPVDVYR